MTFGFASPWILLLLVIIPLLAILSIWPNGRFTSVGVRYSNINLTRRHTTSLRLTMFKLLPFLRLITITLVIVALARPQISEARELVTGEGIDMVLALDISSSMASLDFMPKNKLQASKQVVHDFINDRRYDRIGLVVFAKSAFIQSPPTLDHGVLLRLVKELDVAPNLNIKDGTAIGLGLANAANMLKDSPADNKVIILLTDGVNNAGAIDPLTAASAVKALNIKLYTIGVGRTGLIPVVIQDPLLGEQIVYQESELDEETLQHVADVTGGRYFRAMDTEGLRQVYNEIDKLETSELDVFIYGKHTELLHWFLIPALILILSSLGLSNTYLRKIP